MQELFYQLGIDWKLLLSQAANFLILLVVLRIFAYKPILNILHERRKKIEDGMAKAEEADLRLQEASGVVALKLKEADQRALEVLRATEIKSKELESRLLDQARQKEAELLKNTDLIIAGKAEAAKKEMRESAIEMVKSVLIKTVELDPKAIDEKLIAEAAKQKSEKA